MIRSRLGIVAFYEKDGIVEDYFMYLLNDLKIVVNRLIVVCNGKLTENGRKKILECADDLIIRKNTGYDVGAFQEVMISVLGESELLKYDELVLCNDTFFGPFISFDQIFEDMKNEEIDFWGLSVQPESVDFWENTKRIVPSFIHSFFWVIKHKMLHSSDFWKYWNDLDVTNWNVTQVVVNHEQFFTPYFEKLGFKWDVYIDKNLFSRKAEDNSYTAYLVYPYELIKYGRCPFLKKKCITGNDISRRNMPDNGSLEKAISYIEKNTSYNIEYILNYARKFCSNKSLKDKLLVPKLFYGNEQISSKLFLKTILLTKIKNPIAVDTFLYYLQPVCKDLECYIFCNEQIEKLIISKYGIGKFIIKKEVDFEVFINNVFDIIPINIEYVGILQDICDGSEPACTDISYYKILCENMISNKNYIREIIYFLENNLDLNGVVAPPERFGTYLYKERESFSLVESGWYRKKALLQDDKSNIIYGYNGKYLGLTLINENSILRSILLTNSFNRKILNVKDYYEQYLLQKCRNYSKVYIYGAGGVGIRTANAFISKKISFKGFLVSDNQPRENLLLDHKIYYLSEINVIDEDLLVVVSVEEQLYFVIEEQLKKYKVANIEYSCF